MSRKALLAFVSMLALTASAGEARRTPFALVSPAGGQVRFDPSEGKTVVLHFWATWCESCKRELPSLDRMAAAMKGKVRVIAVAADSFSNVREFLSEREFPGIEFAVDQYGKTIRDYEVELFPMSVVIRGNETVRVEGAWEWMSSAVLRYFRGRPGVTPKEAFSPRKED